MAGKFEAKVLTAATADILDNVAEGVFDNAITAGQRDRFFQQGNHHIAVALAGDLVVAMASGVVYCHPDKDPELWINEVGTGDDWLRQGAATVALGALLDFAEALGIDEAWLGTEPDNLPARAFYQSMKMNEEPGIIYYWDD